MFGFYRACLNQQRVFRTGRTLFISASLHAPNPINKNKDIIRCRRSILYVPGHDRRKIEKLRSLNVDCAVLDCEDGVAVNKKSEARSVINEIAGSFNFGRTEFAVRINSIDSGFAEEDLMAVFSAAKIPDTLMIPKVEDISHVAWISDKLKSYLRFPSEDKLNVIFFVESAKSLLNLQKISEKAFELCENRFQFEGLVFGSDDFCADIGATRSDEAVELLTARQMFVLIAKSFKLQAIDMVHINYKDEAGLIKSCEFGSRMGFTGKQVIHPSQVPIVQKIFSPSPDKIAWAKELICLFKQHQNEGKGAFTFRGSMIDKPLLLQAENIIKMSELIDD